MDNTNDYEIAYKLYNQQLRKEGREKAAKARAEAASGNNEYSTVVVNPPIEETKSKSVRDKRKRLVVGEDYVYYCILEKNRWTVHKSFGGQYSASFAAIKEIYDLQCRIKSKFSNNWRIVKVTCTNAGEDGK